MSARFTPSDDVYIAQWFDLTSAWHMAMDLKRTESSIALRVRLLKSRGAWQHLIDARDAFERYKVVMGISLDQRIGDA